MPNSDFITNIQPLRKKIKAQLIGQIIVIGLVLSLIFTVIAFFIQKILQIPLNVYLSYPLLILLALALTLFYKLKFRKSFEEELSMLDQRFQLKEQLRSAYEVSQTKQDSLIGKKLIQVAGVSLKNIKFQQCYPHKHTPSFIVIGLLIVSFVAIQQLPKVKLDWVGFVGVDQNQLRKPKPISLKLENLTNNALKKRQSPQKELKERVKQFAEKNRKADFSDLNAFKELRLMQQEVDQAKLRSTNNLFSQISPDVASKIPALEDFLAQGFNQEDIKAIEEELKKSFQGEAPSSISEELSSLVENRELEKLLNNLSEGNPSEQQAETESLGGSRSNKRGAPGADDPNFFTEGEGEGGSDEFDLMMRENGPSLPSDKAGSGIKKKPTPSRRTQNEISKISGLSGTGKRHSVKVQTLTMIGTAEVGEQTVIRSYEQDLESAFQKEKIPLSYRQFIKNYFLSIEGRKKNGNRNSR